MKAQLVPRVFYPPVTTAIILTALSLASLAFTTYAEEKITISGKVVKDNTGIPRTRVYVHDQHAQTKHESVTRSDGSFQIEIPSPDSAKWLDLALTAVAYNPRYSFGWAKLFKDNVENVIIELYQPMEISGTVTDMSGDSIQGVHVWLSSLSFPVVSDPYGDDIFGEAIPTPVAETDFNGNFAFRNLPGGSLANLYIAESGFARKMISDVRVGTTGIAFKLTRESRIQGRVTLSETGEPAEGLIIRAVGAYPRPGTLPTIGGPAEALTDENGYYTLSDNLAAGEYAVFLGKYYPDWTVAAKDYVKVSEGQVVRDVDLKLVKGGFITGRVTDGSTGEPIAGYWVSVSDASLPRLHAAPYRTMTGEDGFYRFRAAPGMAMVYITQSDEEGYEDSDQETEYVDVVDGETVSGVDFQVVRYIPLTCRVRASDGQPVAGAMIMSRMDQLKVYAMSDKDGKFVIRLQPGRKFPLKAQREDLQLRGYADLEAPSDTEIEILMERYKTANASGRVMDEYGNPIALANFSLIRWDMGVPSNVRSLVAMTDVSGEYKLLELIIGDRYQVSVYTEGYRKGRTKKFTVTADMPPLENIVLASLSQFNFFLEGTIADTDGNPVAGACVTASSLPNELVMTDESGHYRLDNLSLTVEPGLGIEHPDYGFSRFRYVTTNQTQDFVLTKADGYLIGKVVDDNGKPVERASVSVYFHEEALPSGHVNVGTRTNSQGKFWLENILVDEKPGIYIRKSGLYRIFEDVEMNRDDAVFVLSYLPEPATAAEAAKDEYASKARDRLKKITGKLAPELEVSQWLHGDAITLAELKGKVVVLHFWTGQLAGNVEAVEFLNILQEQYGEKGLVCIGIHEFTAQVDELSEIIRENRPAYYVAVDEESSVASAKGVTFDKYAITEPSGFIAIDGDGINHGYVTDQGLEEKIRELASY